MRNTFLPKPARHHQPGADDLVVDHLWLVQAIAKRVLSTLPRHLELKDLVEDGVIGLIAAARRYNSGRGVPFPLYAKHRVHGAIVDGLRRMDHLSRDSRSESKRLQREHEPIPMKLWGRPQCASVGEVGLASEAGVPEPVAGERWQPDATARHEELSATLREVIGTLPARYGEIVTLYHWHGFTMREIGTSYGINESRVSQIHKRALELMAANLRSRGISSCAAALP